ncbi:Uncharacterized protein dnm_084320 [Desulfonema magnum]|uniref:Uncharacterized protein n=1 Tax=Desulfonema magnum TaxID=45655 RepID=A0A975GTP5_9BACT|nr:Uncharacterized protein dnm_084320 [Desulfonema magnum]
MADTKINPGLSFSVLTLCSHKILSVRIRIFNKTFEIRQKLSYKEKNQQIRTN